MDIERIVLALKGTTDPNEREKSETYLNQMQKIISFTPSLLQIVMSEKIECHVRQAGVIYLKNMVSQFWDEKPTELKHNETTGLVFTIHEQDRHLIRESIVEAIAQSPEVIRIQLAVCVSIILKHDFPGRWPTVVDKIVQHLNALDGQSWMGALTVLYQFVKNYEFKKPKDREPLIESMKIVLPILYERMAHLMTDASQESNYLQKMVLKIFYVLNQATLSFTMLSVQEFSRWMESIRQIIERPVPPETLTIDEEERPELVWWKCKKWAVHIMSRIFERYGNPGQVAVEYKEFADYYLKTFAGSSMQTMLKVLDAYRRKEYVSPRVLFLCLQYMQTGVSHGFSWNYIKPHFLELVRDIIFPLSCHNEKDEELWQEDPQEFIRTKYDLFDELTNPTRAAVSFLSACMKRKGLLSKVVQFICDILNNPSLSPQQYDGALHMIGSLAPNLMKVKIYKNELENMLLAHVFPRFSSPCGFLRARACWCVQTFSEISFKNDMNITKALELVVNALLNDPDLPVKIEGALAMQMLLGDQSKIVEPLIETQIRPIILALLKLISETENDDLTTVVQKLISTYTLQIIPVAIEIAENLANIFIHLLQSDEGAEDRAITAIGVLNTLETVMDAVEENTEMTKTLEPIVIKVIKVIFDNTVMDFYEEAMNLIYSLTLHQITPAGWELFNVIYEVFTKDAIDYFTDMMPALHNYITVDPDAFLSTPERMMAIYEMCKKIFSEDVGEDTQCHAAKLLEVIVLQFRGKIDTVIRPICELVLGVLTTDIKTSELRTMCLQDLIAILHYNPPLMLQTLQTFQSPDSSMALIDRFIKQWLFDTDCFLGLHDRKMCLIGLTILMGMPQRPQIMAEVSNELVPSCLTLFEGLQKAYESKAQQENAGDDDDSGEEEDGEAEDALASDEDEINEEAQQYLETLAKSEQDSGNDDEYSDTSEFECETDLESYETVLDGDNPEVDEFILFKDTLQNLQHSEPHWYTMLVANLTADHVERLQKVFNLADQRKAAAESKKIDQSGGYQFNVQQVPTSFNFGGGAF